MNGLFGQQNTALPDISVIYPHQDQDPRQNSLVPNMVPEGNPPVQEAALKYSIGDPIVDKYLNMFLA